MSSILRLMSEMMRAEEEEAEEVLTMTTTIQQYQQIQNESSLSHHGRSTLNHCVINRNREEGHARLYRDYFSDSPTYPETMFRRRFRMRRSLFLRNIRTNTLGCPTAWQGTYTGHVHELTIILEAIASYDLWIWHSFFGLPGSLNDINVLDRFNVFNDLAEGRGPEVNFNINGHDYNMGYYLADGIYPSWPTFVKTISAPQGNKRKYFVVVQESARKDVERAFGVLQSRFAIIRGPSRFWDVDTMKYIMASCIILHNMIVEDERDLHIPDYNHDMDTETPTISMNVGRTRDIKEFIQTHQQIRSKQAHIQLQNDLIEHLWKSYGDNI